MKQPNRQTGTALERLLGRLEMEVMLYMWETGEATVRQVVEVISQRRPIAYTTVMTVMGRLVLRGLLARTRRGRRYVYQAAQSRDQFLRKAASGSVRALLERFGDLVKEEFLKEIERMDREKR